MNSIRVSKWSLTTLVAAAVLAGCASGVKLDDAAPVESRTATTVGAGGTVTLDHTPIAGSVRVFNFSGGDAGSGTTEFAATLAGLVVTSEDFGTQDDPDGG